MDLWESDHEADKEGLEQLELRGFEPDDPDGVIPKCLPHKDMPEFIGDKNKIRSYVEPRISAKTGKVVPTPHRSVKYLQKAGCKNLKRLCDSDGEHPKPVLFQFPAGMSSFAVQQGFVTALSDPQAANSNAITGGDVFGDEYDHGMSDIPGGTKIGRMTFTKKGRCYLNIKGSKEKMNVAESINENKIKNVMMFLPEISDDDESEEPQNACNGDKSGHVLGVADQFFVCSYDVPEICGRNRREKARTN